MVKKQVFVGFLVTFLSLGLAGVVLAESGEGSYQFNNSVKAQIKILKTLAVAPAAEDANDNLDLLTSGLWHNELDASDMKLYGFNGRNLSSVAPKSFATQGLAQDPKSGSVTQAYITSDNLDLLTSGLWHNELDASDMKLYGFDDSDLSSTGAVDRQGVEKNHKQTLCANGSGNLKGKYSKNCNAALGG
jgi:hypothetical protein